MLQRKLDPSSKEIADYLSAFYNGDEDLDSDVVEKYQNFLRSHLAVLISPNPLENPVLNTLLPLISRILNCPLYDDIFVLLLSSILLKLPLSHTLKFFPQDYVLESLNSELPAVVFMIVHLLKNKLEEHDSEAENFLDSTDFLQNALSVSLTKTSGNTMSVALEVEALLLVAPEELLGSIPKILASTKSLIDNDATVVSRYLGALCVLLKRLPNVAPSEVGYLVSFPKLPLLLSQARKNDSDVDLLLLHVMIQSHQTIVDLLDQNPALFSCIEPVVSQCIEDFAENALSSWDTLIDPALLLLYNSVVHCGAPSAVQWSKDFLSQSSLVKDIDLCSENARMVFMATNLARIIDKSLLYLHLFGQFPSVDSIIYPKFQCVLHLFTDDDFFKLLANDGTKIADRTIMALPQNLIFELANVASRFDHSAQYLLSELSSVVLTYLAIFDSALVNSDLWKSKVSTLENLLFNRANIDLGFWKEGLLLTYKEMVGGRNVTKLEPQVDIADKFM